MVLEQQISQKNLIFFTPSETRLASPDGVITSPYPPGGSIAESFVSVIVCLTIFVTYIIYIFA